MRQPFILSTLTMAMLAGSALADEKEAKPIEPATVNLGRPVDFEQDIYPMLESNCIACHNLAINESKLVLEDVESILKGGKRGPSVVAKDPDKSLLYLVAARSKGPVMPPLPNKVGAEAFTPQQLGTLRQWILEGATAGMSSSSTAIAWQPIPSTLKAIYSVALDPWGRFAAAGRANQIAVYDVITGEESARLVDPNLSAVQFDGKPMYPQGAAHRDFVHSLAFSPTGNLLASGGFRTVKLWQRPQNSQKKKLDLPEAVTAAAVSADGKVAAVATADNAIRVFNPADGQVAKTLTGHTARVAGLAFSPDGTKLYSASHDKTVRGWNLADGAAAGQLESPAPINALILNKEGTRVVLGQADNIIRVYDFPPAPPAEGQAVEPPKPALELKGHGNPVTSLALIAANGQYVSGSEDGTVRVWDPNNGNAVRTMTHGGPVTSVAVRPDGKYIASGSANNTAKLWQADNGQQKAELKGDLAATRRVVELTEAQNVAKQLVTITDNAFKAAEKNVTDREEALKKANEAKAAADKTLAEANEKLKKANEALEAAKAELTQKPDDAGAKKKVEDAEKAATTEIDNQKKAMAAAETADRSIKLADEAVKTAKTQLEQAKTTKETAVANSTAADAAVAEAQKVVPTTEKPVRAVAFSLDGKKLATGGDDNLIHLWDAETGVALETIAGHQSPVTVLTFAADAGLLAGSGEKAAIVWDTNPAWQLIGQLGPKKEAPLDLATSPFVGRVLSLAFSPDGKLLATGGGDPSRSGEVMIWDVAGQSLVREIKEAHSDTVHGLEFSRDGKQLVSGAADKFVKIHDVETGKHVRSFEGHTNHVLDVSWRADGTALASAGADNAIKVWTVETGEQQRTIQNYSKQVTSIQFIGISENIVSCGGDSAVKYHKVTNGQNYRSFAGATDYVYSAAASRDENLVVAGGEDGVLRVWNGQNGQIKMSFDPPKPPEAATQQASAAK